MDSISAGFDGDIYNFLNIEICVCGTPRAKAICFICKLHIERLGIYVGVNRNRSNSVITCGSDDSNGDFATVSNE
ncbi:hypothetical protein D3C86_1676700 [compost metagenome]